MEYYVLSTEELMEIDGGKPKLKFEERKDGSFFFGLFIPLPDCSGGGSSGGSSSGSSGSSGSNFGSSSSYSDGYYSGGYYGGVYGYGGSC